MILLSQFVAVHQVLQTGFSPPELLPGPDEAVEEDDVASGRLEFVSLEDLDQLIEVKVLSVVSDQADCLVAVELDSG